MGWGVEWRVQRSINIGNYVVTLLLILLLLFISKLFIFMLDTNLIVSAFNTPSSKGLCWVHVYVCVYRCMCV